MRGWLAAIAMAGAAPGAAAADADSPLPGWMAGCWEQVAGERWVEECWMQPRGGIMLGAGRSGRGERLGEWEATQIVREADGGVAFWASPKGAPRVAFALHEQGAQSVTFVNPAHDFPQRVRYWREGELLKAEVALADGSKAIGFTYRRAP